MKKYLCMAQGCDFVSTDMEEAKKHIKEGHDVVQVWMEGGEPMVMKLES